MGRFHLKKFIVTTALLVVAVAAPPALRAFDLDSLLVQSVGGEEAVERIRNLSSMELTGRILINGQPGTCEIFVVFPDKLYFGIDFGSLSMVQAFDGRTAWQRDHNGQVVVLSGFEKQELVNQTYLSTYSYLLRDGLSGSCQALGREELDSASYYKVAFMPLDKDTVYGYFDTESGRLSRTVGYLDNLETVTMSDDYREVEGVLVSAHSLSSGTGAPISSELFADRIAFDVDVDTAIFSPPADLVKDYGFPLGADSVVIPFEYERGHVYVTVVVNGNRKLRLILDSGASANIYHSPVVEDLNLERVGTVTAKGLSGYDEVQLVRTDSLAIGALKMYRQVAGSMDVRGLGRGIEGVPFGGVLGYDFLSRFPLLVNFEAETITVYDPDSFVPAEGGAEVPFRLTMQIPTVEASLNGIKGDYIVDLGNAFGVILHRDFYDRHGLDKLLDNFEKMPKALKGVSGGLAGQSAYAASFAFGEVRVSSLRVMIPESSQGVTGSAELAGNIGNLLLQQFAVLFDYPSQRLIFYGENESEYDETKPGLEEQK